MNFGRSLIFSIDEHDREGNVSEPGVFLYWQDTRIHVARNAREWDAFKESIAKVISEVDERRAELHDPETSES